MRNTVYDSSLISDGLMSKNLYMRGYKDYLKINRMMQANIAGHPFTGPDLIIFLDIPFELELEHIQQRGRAMEATDPKMKEYYHSVWETYRAWYHSDGNDPILRIDLGKYDFVNNDKDRDKVLSQIETRMRIDGLI